MLAVVGVVLAAAGPAIAGYPPQQPTCQVSDTTVVPGQQITVSGDNWLAGDTVALNFFQTQPPGPGTVSLGSATTDINGHFAKLVTIPVNAAPGTALISGEGHDKAGEPVQCDPAVLQVLTSGGSTPPPTTPATGGGGGGGGLAFTGFALWLFLLIGLALLAIGVGLVLAARDRDSRVSREARRLLTRRSWIAMAIGAAAVLVVVALGLLLPERQLGGFTLRSVLTPGVILLVLVAAGVARFAERRRAISR
jgi:hypothetical protein